MGDQGTGYGPRSRAPSPRLVDPRAVESAREIMGRLEIGLHEAKAIVAGREVRDQLADAHSLAEVKAVLARVIDKLYPADR